MAAMLSDPAYNIMSVSFTDQQVEITFQMPSDITDDVVDVHTRYVSALAFRDDIDAVLQNLVDLLNASHDRRRNPVTRFRNPSRPGDDSDDGT